MKKTKGKGQNHLSRRGSGRIFYEFPGGNFGLSVTTLPPVERSVLTTPRVTARRFSLWTTRTLLLFAALLLTASAGGSAVLGYYWATTPSIPALGTLVNKQFRGATLYDRSGEELFNIGYGATRRTVELSEIPEHLVQATIAAEDERFYQHRGVDPIGIGRAAWADVRHQSTQQGGSTITQQLVKNTLLSHERSFDRKLKEAVMATKMERKYGKEEILTIYFNQIFYGQRSWGVGDAAWNYFGKEVKGLTLAESAMLAGLPAAPTTFSPLGSNPELAEMRQEYVLRQMTDLGYIRAEVANQAAADQLAYHPAEQTLQAPHFVMYVRELLSKEYSEKEIEEGGFKIYTTLDLRQQQIGEELVKAQVERLRGQSVTNGALVSIDPKTGEILAMVGSRDWNDDAHGGKFNIAVANRQPGSAIKPFNYLSAFERGVTAATITHDRKTNFGGNPPYIPNNYDGRYRGNMPARLALANSLNIPAVEVLRFVGVENFIQTLHRFGISTLNAPPGTYGLALTLGGGEVKLLDLTSAYGALANAGTHQEPRAILRIVDGDGRVLLDQTEQKEGKRVTTEQLAYYTTHILSDNQARSQIFGTSSPLYLGDRPAAAKTGTTDDFRDAWTFGYAADGPVVGTWVGNNDNRPMGRVAGSLGAAPIWRDFMKRVLEGVPARDFTRPGGIVERPVNRATGLPLPEGQTGGDREIFIDGIKPAVLPDTSIKERPKDEPEERKDEEKQEKKEQAAQNRKESGSGEGGDAEQP